jgi:hypothetical protein
MSLFSKFLKGNYKIFISCPNCGIKSEVRVPRGVSVTDFVKGGKCKCDKCGVTFYPDEYTTEHFEKQKNNAINRFVKPTAKPNRDYKKLANYKEDYKENIKWF